MSILSQMTGPFSDLSVLGLMADDAACGHYRVKFPLEALARGGARCQVVTGVNFEQLMAFDVILAQRQYHPTIYDLLQQARALGKLVIYEIDDLVHKVDPNSVAYGVYRPGSDTLKGVEKFMRNADGLFTTSVELASQYATLNQRTWVLPNAIDLGLRDWTSPVERDPRLVGKTVIGWLGSITHQDDWQPLVGVLDTILAEHPDTVFAIASAHRIMEIFCRQLNLPEERVVRLDPVPFMQFPVLPAQIDIGLCPVVNTPFNRGKSDLKPLEYGARGVPYVASSIAPYVRLHQHTNGAGGFLAGSRHDWVEAISHLVSDQADRQARGAFMKQHVTDQRQLSLAARQWADAIREARDMKLFQPETERIYQIQEKPGRNEPCPCGSQKKYKKCCVGAWG